MKAVVYTNLGSPEVLRIEEVPKPVPRDNEVLVKIMASSVTAVDRGFRHSLKNNAAHELRQHRLGYYLAGEVEEVGKNVTRFKKGDRVFGGDVWSTGAYAEYKCVRESGVLSKIPAEMSYETAVVLTYGGLTALPFLRDVAKVKPGKKVLVIGAAGSIGTYAVQLARYFGAEVTGVCRPEKTDLVKSLGAAQVIDYTHNDFTKNTQAYDVIFDTPAKSSFSQCKSSLTRTGKYLTTIPWPGVLWQMLRTSISSRKKAVFAPMGLRSKRQKTKDLAVLVDLVITGQIKPVIDKVYPMEQIVAAYQYIDQGLKQGNVVISINSG